MTGNMIAGFTIISDLDNDSGIDGFQVTLNVIAGFKLRERECGVQVTTDGERDGGSSNCRFRGT